MNRRHPAHITATLIAVVAGLTGCNGSDPTTHVASLPSTSASQHDTSGPATPATGDPTRLVDQWATCERHHGDPTQADPIIDSHGVINIVVPPVTNGGPPVVTGGPETQTGGPCSQYLAAAQHELRAANPVSPPPTRSELVSYATCMRANGVPNYPYPTGEKDNFNSLGIDSNSPTFEHANKICGEKLNLPAWWVNGWGPPGDVSVKSAFPAGGPPPGGGRSNG